MLPASESRSSSSLPMRRKPQGLRYCMQAPAEHNTNRVWNWEVGVVGPLAPADVWCVWERQLSSAVRMAAL
jgi:hypothetical protein